MLVAQTCPTFCNLKDCSPSGSSVHGILQARILEWVAISFSAEASGIKPRSNTLQADSLPSEPPGKPQIRNQTHISHIENVESNHWTTREIPGIPTLDIIWKISCVHLLVTLHFLLQHLEKVEVLVVQSFLTLQPHRLQPTRLLGWWDSPGKNTGVSCHFPLQGIFLTQVSNPDLLPYRQILYSLSHQYFILINSDPNLLEQRSAVALC